MTPRRVTLVVGSAAGGMAAHVRMLAAGLARSGTEVQVLAPAASAARLAVAGVDGVTVSPVEVGGRPSPGDVRTLLRLRRLLVAGSADVVHAHGLRAGALCALAMIPSPCRGTARNGASARQPGRGIGAARVRDGAVAAPGRRTQWSLASVIAHALAPSRSRSRSSIDHIAFARPRPVALVVTVHSAPPDGIAAALVYRVLERVVAARAACVLCVSPDLEARLRRAGARNVGRAVVPAPDPARPAADGSPVPSGRPVVLAVGRLAAQKGLGTLLAAAASWRDMEPAPQVVIAGEGPLLAGLRGQAARLGVDASFLGHRDDVPALLAACDVFVLPSRWEGQPLILQEALRAGAAIVATRAGGIPDLAGPEAAYLVAPEDVAQLASGVRAVLLDRGLADRLRSAARRRAATLPAEQDALAAVRAVYADAIAPDG